MMELNELTRSVIQCAINVHRKLGPGLLESAYECCLEHELIRQGLLVQRQLGLPLIYDGLELDIGYRLDLLVEYTIVVEVKSVESLNEVHTAQVLTYLKLSNAKIGLLMNFNTNRLVDGLKRLVRGGYKLK